MNLSIFVQLKTKTMKTKNVLHLICQVMFLLMIIVNKSLQAQIANSYPNDVGIQNSPDVLYVEKFDDGMTNILSRYTDKVNTAGMILDTDLPPGSLSGNSIKMTSIKGTNTGGHLFRNFSPGFDNTVFVRYYVKYPATSKGYFHHEGVWFGGYDPSTSWPNPQAGTCGLGSSRISIAYENVWSTTPPGMDTYLYWGDMQSWNGGSSCYGNALVTEGRTDYGQPSSPTAPLDNLDQWMCVEMMIKLNNPVTAYNGELRVWENGIEVGYWGPGFPKGHWLKDKWYNNPADPAFQGFRWRTNINQLINWVWFEFYHDDPAAPSSSIKFDHLVMAKKYIGPIATSATGINNISSAVHTISVFPNPANTSIKIQTDFEQGKTAEIKIYNMLGKEMFSKQINANDELIDISNLPNGVYLIKSQAEDKISTQKFIVQH